MFAEHLPGEVSRWSLPSELRRVDCLVGRAVILTGCTQGEEYDQPVERNGLENPAGEGVRGRERPLKNAVIVTVGGSQGTGRLFPRFGYLR